MAGSLPEMGDWDSVFDDTYLQTYVHLATEEQSREQAFAAAKLAEVEPGAEILEMLHEAGFVEVHACGAQTE